MGDYGAGREIHRRAEAVWKWAFSRAADIGVGAAKGFGAPGWGEIIFDRAETTNRGEPARGLKERYISDSRRLPPD